MRKSVTCILLSVLLIPGFLRAQVLSVPEIIQEEDQWCWAACSKCIFEYFHDTIEQCTIAEYTRSVATWHSFGTVNCCVSPNQGCNYWNYNWSYAGSIEDILRHFKGINTVNMTSTLSLSAIQTEIDNGHPFIFRWGWVGGGGHFMVGHGLAGNYLYYNNSLVGYGHEISNYNWVVNDGSTHTWTHTQKIVSSCKPPAQPAPINGSIIVCQGTTQAYSIPSVQGASSYTWTLPAGWSGSSTSNMINVTAGSTSGTISVIAKDSCGNSAPRILYINVQPSVTQPGNISGNTSVCTGTPETYSISPVAGATSYKWTFPQGWKGDTNSTSVSVIPANTGGNISVIAINDCGNSPAKTLLVTGNSADTSVSVNGFTLTSNAVQAQYQWVNCPGMEIINGETNKTFTPAKSGVYAVIINQNNCIDTSGCFVLYKTGTTQLNNKLNFSLFPNPTGGLIKVECTGADDGTYTLKLIDNLGKIIDQKVLLPEDDKLKAQFDLTQLSHGVYFLKVESPSTAQVLKVEKL